MRPAPALRVAALMLLVTAPPARAVHDPALTADEEKCQQALAAAVGKFQAGKTKCLVKCDRNAAKGKNPDSDCAPPFAGKTAACVVAAEGKATDAAAKKCGTDCPECYAGGDCPAHAAAELAAAEAAIDVGVGVLRCDDSGSPDALTAVERQCRQTAGLEAAKFARAYGKCLAKCRAREQKGKLPPGTCTAGAVTDSKTSACLDKVFETCVTKITEKCPDPPECLGDLFFVCFDVAGAVESFDPGIFCGSPGAAFVDPLE